MEEWTWVDSYNSTGFVEVSAVSECGLLVAAEQQLRLVLNVSAGGDALDTPQFQ